MDARMAVSAPQIDLRQRTSAEISGGRASAKYSQTPDQVIISASIQMTHFVRLICGGCCS